MNDISEVISTLVRIALLVLDAFIQVVKEFTGALKS